MGGQFDYYGLWISDEFSHGQSRAEPHCSTYGSPQLSAEPHFQLAALEVWRVGPEPKVQGTGMVSRNFLLVSIYCIPQIASGVYYRLCRSAPPQCVEIFLLPVFRERYYG